MKYPKLISYCFACLLFLFALSDAKAQSQAPVDAVGILYSLPEGWAELEEAATADDHSKSSTTLAFATNNQEHHIFIDWLKATKPYPFGAFGQNLYPQTNDQQTVQLLTLANNKSIAIYYLHPEKAGENRLLAVVPFQVGLVSYKVTLYGRELTPAITAEFESFVRSLYPQPNELADTAIIHQPEAIQASYDREAAVAYANRWTVDEQYNNADGCYLWQTAVTYQCTFEAGAYGVDGAHFVNMALRAGGVNIPSYPAMEGVRFSDLYNWLIANEAVIEMPNDTDVMEGDVILAGSASCWGWGGVVVGFDADGKPLINVHSRVNQTTLETTDEYNMPYTNMGLTNCGATTRYAFLRLNTTIHVVLLLADNHPLDPANLTPYASFVRDNLVTASLSQPDVPIVLLMDEHGEIDTAIYHIQNGVATKLVGLPDQQGRLQADLFEYNMADGPTLHGFFRWIVEEYPNPNIYLSLVGHGSPLSPDVDILAHFPDGTTPPPPSTDPNIIFPLPSRIGADPTFSDVTPVRDLLTPSDLEVALNGLTNFGANPVEVLDLTHCFAATIEEFYSLKDQAKVLVGSPNYAYFAADIPGRLFEALDRTLPAEAVAAQAVAVHETRLNEGDWADENGDVEHPRIMTMVDGTGLEAIKTAMDLLSALLMQELENYPAETVLKLKQAYLQTNGYYDTTFCSNDWELASPDALVDIRPFMQALMVQFGGPIAVQAQDVMDAVDAAVISQAGVDGRPWYAPIENVPTWTLNRLDLSGLALYAELEGRVEDDGKMWLSWLSRYYTTETNIEQGNDNPRPYRFILPDQQTTASWSDVFEKYWELRKFELEVLDIRTEACLTELKPIIEPGEIKVLPITYPIGKFFRVGMSTYLPVTIETLGWAYSLVKFEIRDNGGTVVFSNTVLARCNGSCYINPTMPWVPEQAGKYQFTVTADADNRLYERNEDDNVMNMTINVFKGQSETVDVQILETFMTDPLFTLKFLDFTPVPDTIYLQIYQSSQVLGSSTFIPQLAQTVTITNPQSDTIPVILSETTRPGPLWVVVWAFKGNGVGLLPKSFLLNFAPPETLYPSQERFFFQTLTAEQSNLLVCLESSPEVLLFGWEAYNPVTAKQVEGEQEMQCLRFENRGQEAEYSFLVKNSSSLRQPYRLCLSIDGNVPSCNGSVGEFELVQHPRPTVSTFAPDLYDIGLSQKTYLPVIDIR